MAVNGINLAINQRWLTRGGEEVEVIYNDGHGSYPWDLFNGGSVTDEGFEYEGIESEGDLITLIQDEHGFIPWSGGECPVGDEFAPVEYKMRDCSITYTDVARDLYWENTGGYSDIIAYRVVKQEVKPAKVDAKEEQKYTVEQVYEAINAATDEYAPREIAAVKEYLAKTQDPDYKLYLELKAKFE